MEGSVISSLRHFPVFEWFEDPTFAIDPAPLFAEAHKEGGKGVFRNPNGDGLVAIKYQTIQAIQKHPLNQAQNRDTRKSGPSAGSPMARLFDNHSVFMNEPVHQEVRKVALKAISWPGNKTIASRVAAIAHQVLDSLPDSEEIDLVNDYAKPVAAHYWCQLCGISPEEVNNLIEWTTGIGGLLAFHPTDKTQSAAAEAANQLTSLMESAAQGIDYTAVSVAKDLLKEIDLPGKPSSAMALIAAMSFDGVDGGAGMIANALHHLFSISNLEKSIRTNPNNVSSLWLETARLTPPLLGLFRCPIEDFEYEGVVFPAGINILTLNAAGNQDPDKFDNPEKFDLNRKKSVLLSFGGYARACIGQNMARIQSETAIIALLERTKEIKRTSTELDWGAPGLLRVKSRLPVCLRKA